MEGEQSKKPLDPLVKTALALCISLIVITVVGMVLTAPDRSIPPYSVMAQQGEIVTVNVPPSTRDPEIEALLVRFQVVGHGDRNQFARLKIKPTTPADPAGLYQRVTIYVFDNPGLSDDASLKVRASSGTAALGSAVAGGSWAAALAATSGAGFVPTRKMMSVMALPPAHDESFASSSGFRNRSCCSQTEFSATR